MNKSGTVYLVEGLPGSGKTTLSAWLQNHLQASFITEDAPGYPNDFSGIAGITAFLYSSLRQKYPLLQEYTYEYESIQYVNIRNMETQYPLEKALIQLLRQWEFGNEFNPNITLPHYITCSLGLMFKWIGGLTPSHTPIIMDSVWLQNPINELLYRNATEETILQYCTLLANAFAKFNVSCIYLRRDTAAQSVDFASRVKGESWSGRAAGLIAQTPYGLANNLKGIQGMTHFFEHRCRIEKRLLSRSLMNHKSYLIDEHNWDHIREQIRKDFAF